MNLIGNYFRELYRATISGWNRFWFTAIDPATLGLVRLLARGDAVLYPSGMVYRSGGLLWPIGLANSIGAGALQRVSHMRGVTYSGSNPLHYFGLHISLPW